MSSVQEHWPTHRLLGCPVHALTMEQVLSAVDGAVRSGRRLLIGVVNAAKLVNMRRERALGDAVLQADLILPDGMSVVWASRLLGKHLPERVPGIDLMERILEYGSQRGYRVFCLGATEEVLSTALKRIRREHPGIVIAGWHHGYFKPEDEPRVVEQIRASGADVLFAAMTSPKKERFLALWADAMGVPVCHGVGGAFDVLAGKVRRAPSRWQRMGLEWLYRVLQEPRRMWRRYLVTNTLFCWMVLSELVRTSRPAAAGGGR